MKKKWAERVACAGVGEAHRGFWWGNLQEGDFLEDLGI
jgi:hypothetical protein